MWDRPVRWDSEKARRNLAKHGVSLEEAETALRDPLRSRRWDDAHSFEEDRFIIIGMSNRNRLLTVIVAWEEIAGTIRIISAWRSTKRERHEYEDRP